MKKIGCIAVSLLVAGAAHADVYDIGTAGNITLLAGDTLTNTVGITDWGAGHAVIVDGSDLSSVDFASLNLTSWTASSFNNSPVTKFDGTDLSGVQINLTASSNNFRDDSFDGANFSGATINAGANQPFVSTGSLNLQNANFSGTTFNFTYTTAGAFGFNTYSSDLGGNKLAGADFSDSIWVFGGNSDGDPDAFNLGAGSTTNTVLDMALAADFSGADFSQVGDIDTMDQIIANLGESDAGFGNGAFYDANTVLSNGYTTADLAAAGWQVVPEPATLGLVAVFGGGVLFIRRRFMI